MAVGNGFGVGSILCSYLVRNHNTLCRSVEVLQDALCGVLQHEQVRSVRANLDDGGETIILQDSGNLQGPIRLMEGRRSCKTMGTCKG